MDAFQNSAYGEKTAQNFYTYVTWGQDPMNPDLVSYWEEKGLVKEAYYDTDEAADGIIGDYYVYSPVGAKESGTKMPLIIMFHGGGEPAFQTETFEFTEIAIREGAILMALESFALEDESIVNNIENAYAKVVGMYPVDESRVYAAGSSMGGSLALGHAVKYMDRIAAVGVMDQFTTLNTVKYKATEEDMENLKKGNLPIMYLGGLADMYGMYNISNEFFFFHTEGASEPAAEGWNKLMEVYGIADRDLTPEKRYINSETSLNIVTYFTGLEFDATEIVHYQNNRIYKNYLEGTDTFCSVIVEKRPHAPTGYDAEIIWDFLSGYAKNMETGELIELK